MIILPDFNERINLGTLYNVLLRIARNFLETRENVKIFYPSILPYKFGLIFMRMKQKKNSKWQIFKIAVFQNRQFSKFFCEKLTDPSLG